VSGFFLIVEFLKEVGSDVVFTGFKCGGQFIHGGNELLHLILIGAFRCGLLGSGQTATSRDLLLANGVSEALIATAAGLVLGILAMFFYSVFRNRVQSLISDLEIATAHIIGLVALNYGKKREGLRVAVDDEY